METRTKRKGFRLYVLVESFRQGLMKRCSNIADILFLTLITLMLTQRRRLWVRMTMYTHAGYLRVALALRRLLKSPTQRDIEITSGRL